ncbi:hypothetical protein [Rubellimicrobium roseum]|uniref:Pilus assembly protein PilP n=1 Tax=Rubellimicrobium roseum TaxID=687525 RepID=A0A5C4NM50_9RHOB|nr:hypothetical protein [Rubellimicrobium roseum]TNC73767.1 hypothetical protein FHG71_04630 [Rubellimicrobium roseum]
MADTWDLPEPLRPRARPDALAPEPTRPQGRPESLGHVNSDTEAKATIPDRLPLDRTTLIGLFGAPDGNSALLRLASGKVVRVAEGAEVDGGRVLAIDEQGLRLQRGAESVLLTLPS